jgi:hypothetical protein
MIIGRILRTAMMANPAATGVFLFGLMVLAVSPLSAADLRCPPRLPGPHPGFEQVGPVPAAHWLLWRMRLFDAPPGEHPSAELMPSLTVEHRDAFTLNWHISGDDDVLMLCLYDGSGTYYRARFHPPPVSCILRDDNGLTQAWCEQP